MGLKSGYTDFKNKYDVKSIKLVLLTIVLVGGTLIFIRRSNTTNVRIQNYVRSNLVFTKGFNQISTSLIGPIDSSNWELLNQLVKIKKATTAEPYQIKDIKMYEDKFRLNDSLYSVNVFLNIRDSVIVMSTPVKF